MSYPRSVRRARGPLSFLAIALVGGFSACSSEGDGSSGDGGGDGDMPPMGGAGGAENTVDTSLHTYDADDPKIQFMGRFDFTDPKVPVTSAPASEVTIRFEGDSVTAVLGDERRYNKWRNFYDVIVDGEFVRKVALEVGQTKLELVSGLEPGVHTLTLARRTEAVIGKSMFLGFEIGGTLLDPPAEKTRRVIVIGDSITAGSGNEAANSSPECAESAYGEMADDGWGIPYHNAYLAYGPVAARTLNAAYHVAGVGGIGLIRNYTSVYDTRPMPAVYDLLFMQEDPLAGQSGGGGVGGMLTIGEEHLWPRDAFVPDAVVVALGTNDLPQGDTPDSDPRPDLTVEEFAEAYIAFVDDLRQDYPNAVFFGMSSPMLGDGWPNADDTYLTDHREAIALVDSTYESTGFEDFVPIIVEKTSGGGCGTHPDVEDHEVLATAVSDAIQTALGW